MSLHTLQFVSLSSSGSHGFLFEGAWRALEAHAPNFDEWCASLRGVAGTSGGAIMALAIALSLNRAQRERMMNALADLSNVVRNPDVSLLVHRYGFEDGTGLRSIVADMLCMGGLNCDTTLADLSRLLRMRVVFVAHDLGVGSSVHLEAATAPTMRVVDAVFASCAIPILFAPLRHGKRVLCDGVLSEYIPDVFPEDATLHLIVPTIYDNDLRKVRTWFAFMNSLLLATIAPQRPRLDALAARGNTIVTWGSPMESMRSLDTVDNERMRQVLACGYVAALGFCGTNVSDALGRVVAAFVRFNTARPSPSPQVSGSESEDDPCD